MVVITGAGQGLGRAYAARFACEGAVPVVVDRNAEACERVAGEIAGSQPEAIGVVADVSDEQAVGRLVETAMDRYGRIDVLINNAAIFSSLQMRPFEEIPVEEWRAVLDVNVTGAFLCARAVSKVMRAAKWGRIINVSSATVTMGRPWYLHYVTSKAALIGMTRGLARELGPDGITVNTVLPGATYTEVPRATVTEEQKRSIVAMQCVPRPGEPADLEDVMLFLASDASRFVTGQSITVDGGLTHI